MREGTPSRTALAVAMHRALHQILDVPPLFPDAFALPVLGLRVRGYVESKPRRLVKSWYATYLRATLAARSRIAEDALAAAVARGVRQYVVLGAGLDTFALRNPHPSLRVFEVDHPDTQAWKRKLLTDEHLVPAGSLTFVAVDFERQDLATELRRAGLAPEPTFFSWLGVTPYLENADVEETLRAVASLTGSEGGVAFDFFQRPPRTAILMRFLMWLRARRVARLGEPFRSRLVPAELGAFLERIGFTSVELISPDEINRRCFASRGSSLRVSPATWIAVAEGHSSGAR